MLPTIWLGSPSLVMVDCMTSLGTTQPNTGSYTAPAGCVAAGSVAGAAPLRWDAPLTRIPSEGLELIDSQGSTSLWRITACD